MSIQSEIKQAARDMASQMMPRRCLCKILDYYPDSDGGPTVRCVPYSRIADSRHSFRTEEAFHAQYASILWVTFPFGNRFHVNKEVWDVYADAPFNRARECYPVMKPGAREEAAGVPKGWTKQEVQDQNIDPKNIRMRIMTARGTLKSMRACRPDEPEYPMRNDVWYGPLREVIDRKTIELWSAPMRMLARFDERLMDVMSKTPRFPLAAGTSVVWRDKREHPLQPYAGSSAVNPYPRFIWSLADPGYIINVARALKEYFRRLDQGTAPVTQTITSHEVISFRDRVPEVDNAVS